MSVVDMKPLSPSAPVTAEDVENMLNRYQFDDAGKKIIAEENLLPIGLLSRLQQNFPQYSGLMEDKPFLFEVGSNYKGLDGFRKVCAILKENGIELDGIGEREFYIEAYRFMATSHSLNMINWDDYENDSIYQLVIPQPGMINPAKQSPISKLIRQKKKLKLSLHTAKRPTLTTAIKS